MKREELAQAFVDGTENMRDYAIRLTKDGTKTTLGHAEFLLDGKLRILCHGDNEKEHWTPYKWEEEVRGSHE